MIDLKNMSAAQWLNVVIFAIGSLAMAGWWQDFVSPSIAVAISGALTWVSSLLNFVLTGKAPSSTPPAS